MLTTRQCVGQLKLSLEVFVPLCHTSSDPLSLSLTYVRQRKRLLSGITKGSCVNQALRDTGLLQLEKCKISFYLLRMVRRCCSITSCSSRR